MVYLVFLLTWPRLLLGTHIHAQSRISVSSDDWILEEKFPNGSMSQLEVWAGLLGRVYMWPAEEKYIYNKY